MDTSIIIHSDDVIQHFNALAGVAAGAIANRKRTRKRERDVEYNKKYNINPVGLEGR